MAAPKSRLGRGLGALIASGASAAPKLEPTAATAPATEGTPPAPGFQEIDVQLVEPSPYQPRKDINAEQLNELVELRVLAEERGGTVGFAGAISVVFNFLLGFLTQGRTAI